MMKSVEDIEGNHIPMGRLCVGNWLAQLKMWTFEIADVSYKDKCSP